MKEQKRKMNEGDLFEGLIYWEVLLIGNPFLKLEAKELEDTDCI